MATHAGALAIAAFAYAFARRRANDRRYTFGTGKVGALADDRVTDLHLWRVGPRHMAAVVSIVTHHPREPQHYEELLGGFRDLAHVTVEVTRCSDSGPSA